MLHLPQEILAEIIALAVPAPPNSCNIVWRDRQRDLASFSLVHSSWTRIAQELLFVEHLISSHDTELARKTKRKLELGTNLAKTKWLTVKGYPEDALKATGNGSGLWKNVKHLIFNTLETVLGPQRLCAQFPHLETRHLSCYELILRKVDRPNVFAHLRRLVLDDPTTLAGNTRAYKSFFSPSDMPSLSHLSVGFLSGHVDVFGEILASLVPQLECLALANVEDDEPQPVLFESLNRLSAHSHLSITENESEFLGFSEYFDDTSPLRLASLHLRAASVYLVPDNFQEMCDVANGTAKHVIVSKLVLYGSKEEIKMYHDLGDLANVEWRTGPEPPFGDFDGR